MLPADREPPAATPATPPSARRFALNWFSPAYAPDPALVRRGRMEMGLGVGLLMTGSVAVAGALAVHVPIAPCIGIVVTQGIMAAGLLAGSRLARGLTMVGGVLGVLGAAGFMASLRTAGLAAVSGAELALGAGMLLLAIGSSLATLAPAARAWHDLQGGAWRAKRKAKSLTEWRGSEP